MTLPSRPTVHRALARGGQLGIAAVLTTTTLSVLGGGAAQAAGTDPYPALAAATWLRANLPAPTETPDALEAALGLRLGGDTATATTLRDNASLTSGAYTGTYTPANTTATPPTPATGDPQPDATARVAWYVQQLGGNATAYGSSGNLVATLAVLVDDTTGRLGEETGDATPTIPTTAGQVFATAALAAAGNPEATQAVAYTAGLQCNGGATDGAFSDALPAPAPAAQTCDATKPSVQATALYVIGTQGIAGADASRAKAVAWLARTQQSNGRWVADGGAGMGDATSTALATYAVGLANRPVDAGQGALWLRSLQLLNAGTCSAFAAGDVGAVAPDGGTYAGTAGRLADFRAATSRSLLVLGRAPGGPAVTDNVLSVPRFSQPGKPVQATVRTAPRNLICASAPTLVATRVVAGYDSTADFTFTAGPDGPTTATIVDPTGQVDTATVTSLPQKKIPFSFRDKRVRVGKNAVVKVRGLAAGESVSVKFRGARKNATVANGRGEAKLRFRVTGRPGYVKVKVTGQYNNRNRTKNIIVTRR